ncbi:hypothetical protein JXB41_09075 [Candidatus Woesearchaeota archaeon]|nr:hypothetical protein [Candidatus Woesearchaeota archaeon]
MKTIILDTNFLLIPYTFKVDIFSEIDRIMDTLYEIYVLKGTVKELENIIEKQRGKHKYAAGMALELIKKKKVNILCSPLKKQKSLYMADNSQKHIEVDEIILNIADKNTIIATQDKELKQKLKKKNINLIVLRNKKYLELI